MGDWTGIVRERWGTVRTAGALLHPHLMRVRMRGKDAFRRYARPIFEGYVQSLSPHVRLMTYSEMLQTLAIDHSNLGLALPALQGYVGLTDWERIVVATLARKFGNRPVFEIGTAAGSTAVLLAQNTGNTVFTLDLPLDTPDNDFALTRLESDDQVLAGRERGSILRQFPNPRVQELLSDSATFDYTPYHDQIGLFFVDGAHSYEYVRSDTLNAAHCCSENGIIAWHDFGSSRDVSRWLNELASLGPRIHGITGTTLAWSTDIRAIRARC